jgi:subtilisin family serine protease
MVENLVLGQISSFSSLGPRRVCSNAANPSCTTAVQKPEVSAPGELIMSSFAAGTATRKSGCFDTKCLDPDGQHIINAGTSMAAPHVTGGVALLLGQNPALTVVQIKTALQSTRTDSFTGSTPNNTWGYGKLAIDLAINAISPPVPVLAENRSRASLTQPFGRTRPLITTKEITASRSRAGGLFR